MKKLDETVVHTPNDWYPETYIVGDLSGHHVTIFLARGTWHIRLGYGDNQWLDGVQEVTAHEYEEALNIAQVMLMLKHEGFSLKC